MSKYIIDTETWANLFEVKRVGVYGIGNDIVTDEKTVWSRMFRLDELEELNSDYINENFGELQDEAYKQGYAEAERIWRAPSSDNEFYQKGLEDGKKSTEKGCDGCEHENQKEGASPCCECARVCDDHYIPKRSDRIEVGDEVIDKDGDTTIVTNIHNSLFDGLCGDGSTMSGLFLEDVRKTGRHYDHIGKLLEAIRA